MHSHCKYIGDRVENGTSRDKVWWVNVTYVVFIIRGVIVRVVGHRCVTVSCVSSADTESETNRVIRVYRVECVVYTQRYILRGR